MVLRMADVNNESANRVLVRDRATGMVHDEGSLDAGALHFLYSTPLGRLALNACLARPWFSALAGRACDTRFSTRFIDSFAQNNSIDISDWGGASAFTSFNDFFARQRAYSTDAQVNELVAVADSRLSAYPITPDLQVTIKGSPYTLAELTANCPELERFSSGTALVFRLGVDDYHHYVHVDDGRELAKATIPGILHTVRPINGNDGVYRRNTRVVNVLQTEHCGRILYIEVGATLVARIVNRDARQFKRLDEKGHFEFGGSTIILLLGSHIHIDDDILAASAEDIETRVEIGEKIGVISSAPPRLA
ncbi:MAG: phosphatidylserine decarboxylase [Actinomycetaceae bacterium]|nr:phosphatidylserine decarboxylase [Actinomycetaceae bacterium]